MKVKNKLIFKLIAVSTVAAMMTVLFAACDKTPRNSQDAETQNPNISQGDDKTQGNDSTLGGDTSQGGNHFQGDDPTQGGGQIKGDNPIDDPSIENFVYSQNEHIGWGQSLKNFGNSVYSDYFENGSPAFVIPGLNADENFILQGIAYSAAKNWALLCGYIKPETENKNSVIFVIDMNKTAVASNGDVYNGVLIKELFLENTDGTAFTGHAGGITVTDKNVWVADGKMLYRLPFDEVAGAPKSGTVKFADCIDVPVLSSYCSYFDGVLWVGEFEYARDKYNTDSAHHNEENVLLTAWTVGYEIDETGADGFDPVTGFKNTALGNGVKSGITAPTSSGFSEASASNEVRVFGEVGVFNEMNEASNAENSTHCDRSCISFGMTISGYVSRESADSVAIPDYVLWHGEKVQGMVEVGSKIVLSTSYGRKNDSALYVYDNPICGGKAASPDCTVTIGGREVPCYILSDAVKVTAPPMTEDMSVMIADGEYKILVASESGAYYYYGYSFNVSKNPTDFVWIYSI